MYSEAEVWNALLHYYTKCITNIGIKRVISKKNGIIIGIIQKNWRIDINCQMRVAPLHNI